MGRPAVEATCPTCGIVFRSSKCANPATGKGAGKVCPQGHWIPKSVLWPSSCAAPRQRTSDQVRDLLADIGVRAKPDALALALVTMCECYERAARVFPRGSVAAGMLDGAFGKAPEVSRRILEVA